MKRLAHRLLLLITVAASLAPAARTQTPPGPATRLSLNDVTATDIRVSRQRVRPGEIIHVSMRLWKQGPLVARSYGTPPSRVYVQGEPIADPGPADRFSVVMTLSGPRGDVWPYRWGIGGDLKLGQSRRVSYPIRLTKPGIYSIYAGIALSDRVRRLPTANLTGIEVIAPGRGARTSRTVIEPTPPTRITVNGQVVPLDQRPIFANATVLVPVRFVMEGLGASVDWEPETRTVTARRGRFDLSLRIGQGYSRANGKEVYVYTPPRIVNGRTMVPVRFVSEALGATVVWDDRTRTVVITTPALSAASPPPAR